MSYRALTVWLLVSAPGDVPLDHLEEIRRAISRWNINHGRPIAATVIPLAWTEHAIAAFGDRPQGLINEQLTDQADLCVAIFRSRLGTETGAAMSGTWEEIERVAEAGKPVAVLRDRTPGSVPSGAVAAAELLRLEKHLEAKAYPRALVMSFDTQMQLAAQIDAFITRAVAQLQQRLEDDLSDAASDDLEDGWGSQEPNENGSGFLSALRNMPPDPSLGVWPRVESTEYVEHDSKGRIKNRRKWFLVLSNQTGKPASNVRYEYILDGDDYILTGEESFDLRARGQSKPIKTMPPGGESRFPVMRAYGSLDRAECRVTWEDPSGTEHTTEATVTT